MQVKSFARFGAVVGCVTFLSACSFISDRSNEYKVAEEGKAITVPAELSSNKLRELYRVPSIDSTAVPSGEYILPSPPDATSSLTDEPYTLKTIEGEAWLELPMPPSKAWPLIDEFWFNNGLTAQAKSVDGGYFSLLPFDQRTSHQELIQALESTSHSPVIIEGMAIQSLLTQGVRRNTSELQVRVFLPGAAESSGSEWQAKTQLPSAERALLEVVGQAITEDRAGSRYSLNAVNIGDESRVRLLEDEAGYSYLQLSLTFKRAWSEVQEALAASPAIVSGSARDEGVIYISYLDEEDIDSWYTLDSQLTKLKKQRNIELRFVAEAPELIIVRAKIISEEAEFEDIRTLMELVFEHIS